MTGAGKIIVLMTLVVWFMGAVPMSDSDKGFADPELSMEDSLYGAAAQVLEPVFAPAGFGEWHMTGALMTGFVAKETVVSSIVTSYNLDPDVDAGNAEDNGDDMGQLPELLHQSLGSPQTFLIQSSRDSYPPMQQSLLHNLNPLHRFHLEESLH